MYPNITQRNRNWPPITIMTIVKAGRVVNWLCEIFTKIFAIHIFRMEDSAVWNGQRTFASEPCKCANSIFLHAEKNQNLCSVFSILHKSRVKNSKTIEDTPLVSCLNSKRNNNTVVFKKSTPIL